MIEKFLSLIERAVVALEKLAALSAEPPASTAGTVATEAPARGRKPKATEAPQTPPPADDDFLNEPESKEPEPPKYERADVKQALQEYGKKHGMEKAQKLFQEVSGVKALSDLPIEKFASVIAATKK